MNTAPQQVDATHVLVRGRKLVYFGGCDYFRLSRHRLILGALSDGLRKFGLNVAASRATTGNHPLYEKLERALAAYFRVESATLASNGWAPNLMVAQALAGQFSHVLIDERAHPCLADAASLAACPVIKFRHRDPADVARIIKRLSLSRPLLMSDGLFSQDGTVAPVRKYLEILPPGGQILLDDAHGAGVLGRRGRGTIEHADVSAARIIQTITLSKGFGVFGGAVLGPRALKDAIVSRSGVFIGSTPLPLPLANAALASIDILRKGSRLRQRLDRNVRFLRKTLRDRGLDAPDAPGPIVALAPTKASHARRFSARLLAEGIYPTLIKYPGGPPDGYFRFAISSEHTLPQLEALARAAGNEPLASMPR